MIVFTTPEVQHIPAIKQFKEAFDDHTIHGGCGLQRCPSVEAWVSGEYRTDANSEAYILYDQDADTVCAVARFTASPAMDLQAIHGYNFAFSVHPDMRRRRYGATILRHCAVVAASRGLTEMYMSARVGNEASWRCMESVGAERVREEDGHYVYCLCVAPEIVE